MWRNPAFLHMVRLVAMGALSYFEADVAPLQLGSLAVVLKSGRLHKHHRLPVELTSTSRRAGE